MAPQRIDLTNLQTLATKQLLTVWKEVMGRPLPSCSSREFLVAMVVWQQQAKLFGGLTHRTQQALKRFRASQDNVNRLRQTPAPPLPVGTVLLKTYQGTRYAVTAEAEGFVLRVRCMPASLKLLVALQGRAGMAPPFSDYEHEQGNRRTKMDRMPHRRCAIYTRKSSEEGLDQAFNSLDAQREAGLAYIQSQAHEGWQLLETAYDDGGYSGATLERPALQQLLTDIRAQRIQVVVVYKVDRLTRSLGDFAQLIDLFDQHDVAFASVTQQFQTTTSMGRLVLNVLLSFAQFEREVTGERIRDKDRGVEEERVVDGRRASVGL